jgi:hypothetical protein
MLLVATRSVLLVIADVLADDATKVFFIQRDDVVEDLAAAASNPSFGRSVLLWGVNACSFGFQSGGRQEGNDVAVENGIVIQNDVAISAASGNVSRGCCTTQSADGCCVTLRCSTLRRSCSMTKKQYNTRKPALGTVKKSKAMMDSRWL